MSDVDGAVVDRFFSALASGDVDAAMGCLTLGAQVWHSFDGIAQDRQAAKLGWEAMVAGFKERMFLDIRRTPIPGGFVQQHMMVVKTMSGARFGWPICSFLKIEDGLISRIDEYIDRAGKLEVADFDKAATPGL